MKFFAVRVGSIAIAIVLALVLSLVLGGMSGFAQRLVTLAGIFVTLAVSLNLINGITGQFSLGHIAFYAMGAYTAAFVSKADGLTSHILPLALRGGPMPVIVSLLIGALVAAIGGVLVGLPSLRLRGDYLAIVTLGVGEIVRIFVQNQEALGRSYGIGVAPKVGFIWLSTLLAITAIAVCRNLQVTSKGLNFLAVREDEIAASAMGVDVTRTKVVAFVIGSAFAGAAGAVAAHYEGFISPNLYTMDYSILIVTMVVLGGTGSITGSVLAALLLFSIPEFMRSYQGTSLGHVLGIVLGIIAAVVLIRQVQQRYHGGGAKGVALNVGALLAAALIAAVFGYGLTALPALQGLVEGNKLRQVIPAITLVVMMLLRPQGLFGHNELSWHSLFGRFGDPQSGPGGKSSGPGGQGEGPGVGHEPNAGLSVEGVH